MRRTRTGRTIRLISSITVMKIKTKKMRMRISFMGR